VLTMTVPMAVATVPTATADHDARATLRADPGSS
jgi:hypothetical protein